MNPLRKAYYVLRYLGPGFVGRRLRVVFEHRTGRTRRRFRPRPWETLSPENLLRPGWPTEAEAYADTKRRRAPAFLFHPGELPELPDSLRRGGERRPALPERVELLAEGRCVCFFHRPTPGPVDWYVNPFNGLRSPRGRTWCDVPDFDPEQGDVRSLWEPARAAWALDLLRARAHGLEADAGRLFWRWVDSWMAACPPFEGVHWKCGQEATVRFFALVTAFWGLAGDPATTPPRWVQMLRLAWATGYRIVHHLHYAISQKNNHAVSEACGLMLVGHVFPELRESARWWRRGRRVLAREIRRQTYPDGSYVQHSMNYQRVMLAGSLLGLRLGELHGDPLPRDVYERVGRGGEFLYQMMEPSSGRLPLYGANDGADMLPLHECDFTDYRPIVQAVHYLVHRRRRLPPGPWDELAWWLFGPEALAAPAENPDPPRSCACEAGGYYTLRRGSSWAMLRCHAYRDRTVQCDPLHLDLWYRGVNVLCDGGSFQYFIPGRPDLEHYFKSIAAHNTVELEGRDPLEPVSRFLWFPWTRARRRHYEPPGAGPGYFEGEHLDYDRPPWRVRHRRAVIALPGDVWVVVDDLLGTGTRQAVSRWHCADAPYTLDAEAGRLFLHTSAGDVGLAQAAWGDRPEFVHVVRGRDEPGRVQGFTAPYYGERFPIPVLEVGYRSSLPLRTVTVLGPGTIIAVGLEEDQAGKQRWRCATSRDAWLLELAPPERDADRILVGWSRATGTEREPGCT